MSVKIYFQKKREKGSSNILAVNKKSKKVGFYLHNNVRKEDYYFLDILKIKKLLSDGAIVSKRMKKILEEIKVLPESLK